jgi:C-terminal processing protease CtpA/Prc
LVVEAQEQMGRRYTDLVSNTNHIAEPEKERDDEAHLKRPRYVEFGRDAILCKSHDFAFHPDKTNDILDRFRTFRGVVLDLRGNPGGYAETLEKFLGGFFDHDVKVADRRGRKALKPAVAKSRGSKTATAKLIVLIDGGSASASELFAKIIQLEKRGTILGDRSSGSVMEAKSFQYTAGTNPVTFYGASITEADTIMPDGKSLEKVGVIPDELILRTPADMAAGRDPVLARAAELVGVKLSPEEGGKLFPIE